MSTARVNITIRDVNNKPPIFEDFPNLNILENTSVGTVIFKVEAFDLDEAPVIRYHLNSAECTARNEEGSFVKSSEYDFMAAFELNPIEGVIKVSF